MIKDRLIVGIAALILTGATLAFAGSSSISIKDGAGASKTYDVITDGSGNFVGMFGLCDQSAAAYCVGVNSSHQASVLDANSAAILSAVTGATPSGSNLMGKVGVDQTTPGTTNGISIVGVNGATALAGTGAVGTGAQRVAVGTDTATIAGTAPGTAGSPSAGVVSVQGVTNGTTIPVTVGASSNIMGNVRVDQTTPGTTNGISIVGVNGATALAGTGAVGTGAQRVAVGTDVATIAGSAPGTAGVPSTNVVSVQGVSSGTTLPVTVGASSNIMGNVRVDQTTPGTTNGISIVGVNGATALAGTGAVGTGAQRVAVGTDTATIAGSAPGIAGTPSAQVVSVQGISSGTTLPVTEANSASILAAVTSAIPSGSNVVGFTSNDPCQTTAHTYKPISIPTGTTTNVVTNGTTAKIYVCQLVITTGIANNVAVIEGTTGGTCGSPAGVLGGTTAANGFNFPANGGVSLGNGGYAIAQTATNDNDLCIITSASGPLAGGITYVVK